MKFHRLLQIPAIAVLFLASCAIFKSTKPKEKTPSPGLRPPKLVGRIASIPADKRFVLIQGYGNWNIESGTILTTRGAEERTANLVTTGESLGQFAAADLKSGLVEVGDAVYSRHVPKPVVATSQPEATPKPSENQPKATPENLQKNN